LWLPADSTLDLADGMNVLLSPSIKKIAIANPEHAPYGRAAMKALDHFKLTDKIRDKLVLGENVSQATQFVQTGNAEIGITALSLALSPVLQSKGRYWEIPHDAYPPMKQMAAIMESSKN